MLPKSKPVFLPGLILPWASLAWQFKVTDAIMVRIFRFPYQKPFIPAFHPLFSRVVLSKEELRKGPGDPVAAGEPQPSGTASCLGFGNAKRVTGNHFSFVSTKKWHKKKK